MDNKKSSMIENKADWCVNSSSVGEEEETEEDGAV